MLNQDEINSLHFEADSFVRKDLEDNYSFYRDIFQWKEAGHQLGDRIDQKLTEHLMMKFPGKIGFERRAGKKCNRSMGDFWFKNSNGCYIPINTKVGVVNDGHILGQPNIASINKVMDGIINGILDSYYLLIIKLFVDTHTKRLHHKVWFTDILDWLDKSVVTFDAGPGQMMLKAKKFHELLNETDTSASPRLDVKTKLHFLKNLFDDGEKRLLLNREKNRKAMDKKYNLFMSRGTGEGSFVGSCSLMEIS